MTDVEASTRLWDVAPDDMTRALVRHDAIIAEAVARAGGSVVKARGEGDSAFCVFTEASAAVACALQLQRVLQREPWPERAPIRVRMGVHAGPAEERDGDYYGDTINRCARVRSAAHGGQVLLTSAVAAEAWLPDDALLRDLGVHRLRDLSKPERIFQLCHQELCADFPPIVTLDAKRDNLPAETTNFVGRTRELRAIAERLERARLVTLSGVGGSGKTRLALRVGAELLDRYADGVWHVELAPVSEPTAIPSAIADALGLREDPARPVRQTVIDHLGAKRALLILDNCEHLIESCASLVADLLTASERPTVLATSRETLDVPGEAVFHVSPLALPGDDRPEECDSVRLFLDRLGPLPADPADIVSLCRRLDGIPLAIELAAAKARIAGVVDVSERLADRFALLAGGSRVALPRHKTLRAMIDWSFDLLTVPERVLHARLSVFVGGWTASAAESVCTGVEIPNLLEALSGLVSKSMCESDRAGRYRMLETIREYAQEKLLHAGEANAMRARLIAWASAVVERAGRHFRTEREADALRELAAEWPNLRAAFESAFDTGAFDAALEMAVPLSHFWELRGHWTEGIAVLDRLLGHASTGPQKARALVCASRLQQDAGDLGLAREYAEEALALAGNDAEVAASARYELGSIAFENGDLQGADALLVQSLDARRALRDSQAAAQSLTQLSYLRKAEGRLDEAERMLLDSRAMFRDAGNKQGISWALTSLSDVAARRGDVDLCRKRNEEALELRRDIGDENGVADSLTNLAGVWLQLGDRRKSYECNEQAHAIYTRLGARAGTTWSMRNLGIARLRLGDLDGAEHLLLAYLERISSPPFASDVHTSDVPSLMAAYAAANLATIACARGRHELALRCIGHASAHLDAIRASDEELAADLDGAMEAARAAVGDGCFDEAYRAGAEADTSSLAALFRAAT